MPSTFFPPRDLWGKSSRAEDLSSRWQASSRRLNARMPRHHRRESIRLSSSPSTISVPPWLRATWSCLVWVTLKWMTTFLWQFQTRKSYRALWPTPPSWRHLLRTTPDSEWMKSSSALWQRLSMSSGSKGLRLRNHLAAGWTSGFFRGAIRLSANACPPSSPKYTTSSQNRGAPPTRLTSVLLLQLLSHPLTALKKKDMSTCLLWMSLWPHISACPQLSDGRQGRAIRPSCAEPHLHSLDAPTRRLDKRLQRFTRWLCSRSSRPRCSPMRKPVWIQPLSGTWGARQTWLYRPQKTTAKAIGRLMSSLIVLECHLWLTIMEMKEAVKVPFLDTPVSSGSLFGPAVEGFAECYTEAQKTSQAMRHFLPKCTSSSSATSRPRPAPTQQTAKPMSTALEPRPAEGHRAHARHDATPSRSAKDPGPR